MREGQNESSAKCEKIKGLDLIMAPWKFTPFYQRVNVLHEQWWKCGRVLANKIKEIGKTTAAWKGDALLQFCLWGSGHVKGSVSSRQGPGFGACLMLFSHLQREKEGWGEILGCDMSASATPAHSESDGIRRNTSLGECQLWCMAARWRC